MKEILEAVPKASAAISLAILVLAVVHETAFFLVVGYQFQALLSPTDYLFSALWWLPYVVLSFLAGQLSGVTSGQKIRALRDKENLTADERATIAAYQRMAVNFFIYTLIFFVSFFVVALLFKDWRRSLWVPPLATACCVAFFLYLTKAKHRPPNYLVYISAAATLFTAAAFMLGVTEGFSSIEQVGTAYVFKLKGEDAEHNWPVMRNLARGVLVHDVLNGRITFYKWEDISMLSLRSNVPKSNAPVCYFFDLSVCTPNAIIP